MVVTGCRDCPLKEARRQYGDVDYYCAHPLSGEDRWVDPQNDLWGHPTNPPPEWCPLRAAPLTVELKTGE